MNTIIKVCFLIGLSALSILPAHSHPVEYYYNDNGNDTYDLFAGTITHGTGTDFGFLINGNSFSGTESFTTDTIWDANRDAADQFKPRIGSSLNDFFITKVLSRNFSLSEFTNLGISINDMFNVDTFDNGTGWMSNNTNTPFLLTQESGGGQNNNSVPEPASLFLLVSGLIGLGFSRKNKA